MFLLQIVKILIFHRIGYNTTDDLIDSTNEILYGIPYQSYCFNDTYCNDKNNEVCDLAKNRCICKQYYEPNGRGDCIECPSLLEPCDSCCNQPFFTCSRGICVQCHLDVETQECISKDTLFYITLSQVALSAAMVLGVLALVMLLYRSCSRPALL